MAVGDLIRMKKRIEDLTVQKKVAEQRLDSYRIRLEKELGIPNMEVAKEKAVTLGDILRKLDATLEEKLKSLRGKYDWD